MEPDPVQRLRLLFDLFNGFCAWGGWALLLLAGILLFARYRGKPGVRWAAAGGAAVLLFSMPMLADGYASLFGGEARPLLLPGLRAASCFLFRGYEILFAFLSVTWGTVLYRDHFGSRF